MRTLIALIAVAVLLIGAVPQIVSAHGGGQDPALAGAANDSGGSEGN